MKIEDGGWKIATSIVNPHRRYLEV